MYNSHYARLVLLEAVDALRASCALRFGGPSSFCPPSSRELTSLSPCSYAKIATLDPEYGLYSSFVGVMIYALFATSKDVTIGPVAVMSLEVGKVIHHVQSQTGGDVYTAPEIATALAFITGMIVLGVGLLRLGWLVEFIPAPAVSGFMTGSASELSLDGLAHSSIDADDSLSSQSQFSLAKSRV